MKSWSSEKWPPLWRASDVKLASKLKIQGNIRGILFRHFHLSPVRADEQHINIYQTLSNTLEWWSNSSCEHQEVEAAEWTDTESQCSKWMSSYYGSSEEKILHVLLYRMLEDIH